MPDPGVPQDQITRLDAIRNQQRMLRSRARVSPLGAYIAGQEAARDAAAEATAHARDTAHLWAALSLAIAGGDDQMRESLAALADTDPDLVDALGAAADSIATTCRDLTKGDRR